MGLIKDNQRWFGGLINQKPPEMVCKIKNHQKLFKRLKTNKNGLGD